MRAALEARYRAALRWYPRAWRADNADAIVGTMLDQADADGRTAPLPGELRNLASSGIGRRFESIAPQAVRDRVAAIALAIGTAYALIMFIASEWAPFAPTGPRNGWVIPDSGPTYVDLSTVGFGPFASIMVLEYGMWVLAFVLVLLGWSRRATAVLLLTVPLLAVIRSLRSDDIAVLQPTTAALIIVALLAVLASVGRPARLHRRTLIYPAIAAAAAAVAFLVISGDRTLLQGRLSTGATLGVLNAPIFGVLLVLVAIVLAIRRQRAWAVAALVTAAPWLALTVLYFTPWVIGMPLGALTGLACLAAAALLWNWRPASAPFSRSS